MATIVSADEARVAWIREPWNSPNELPAWQALWEAVVGPRPEPVPESAL